MTTQLDCEASKLVGLLAVVPITTGRALPSRCGRCERGLASIQARCPRPDLAALGGDVGQNLVLSGEFERWSRAPQVAVLSVTEADDKTAPSTR